MNKIALLVKRIALVVTFVIFGGITISRLFVTVEFLPFYNSVSAAFFYRFFDFLCILSVPVVVLLTNCANRRLSYRREFIIFLIATFLLFFLFSFVFDFTQAKVDAYIVYNLANKGIEYDRYYLSQYPYQYGFVLLLRLFSVFKPYDLQAFIIFNFILYII